MIIAVVTVAMAVTSAWAVPPYVKKAQAAAEANAALAAESLLAQVDTNSVTASTNYTSDAVGQLLVGSAGEGTNAIWVATVAGSTTNWVKITTE